jgi:hypothetical protein
MKKITGVFTAEDGTQYTGELSYEETSYKRPRAQEHKDYYFVNDQGECDYNEEQGDTIDDYRYSVGNYFLTEEEAIKHRELTQARVRIEDAVREHNQGWEADWNNQLQPKFRILYYYGSACFGFLQDATAQTSNTFYLKEPDKDFLKKHEADLKLIMGITN